jgi:CxxH/CxxC protein (TIGR04129 family)
VIKVCKQHVQKALEEILLPHIQSISDDCKLREESTCYFCGKQADYQLYKPISQIKRAV